MTVKDKGIITMSKENKKTMEETIAFSENSKELLTTKLDPMKISFKCKVQGTKQSEESGGLAKGVAVENVRVRLDFTGCTLHQAMKFASGGQSFRVAVQARLRKVAVAELKKDLQIFSMSEVFNPKRGGFTVDPKTALKRASTKLRESGMSTADMIKMLQEQEKAENAAKEAEKGE